jgi:putative tricarboxylic transport membrane protein
MRINDAILGIITIVASILLMLHARTFPALPGVPYGPGFFPNIVLGAMIVAGAILVVNGVRRWRFTGWLELDPWARQPRTYVVLGAIVAAHLFYIFFSDRLGFLATSIVLILCLLLLTRGRQKILSSAAVAVGFSAFVYYVFGMVLRVPLPPGLVQGLF